MAQIKEVVGIVSDIFASCSLVDRSSLVDSILVNGVLRSKELSEKYGL
jgi:stress-induced morphogen